MSEDNCAVYVHINLINGKKYFGITTQEPEKRWKNGSGYYNNAHFKNAIKKYSWENFAHYVLFKNIPIAIAKNIEEMLIREHVSYDPRFGYNKTMGGDLERPSDETRRKISESHKGNVLSEETCKAKSKSMKEYYKNHPEAREVMSKNNPMKNPEVVAKHSKPVEAIDPKTGRVVHRFKSTHEAGRAGFDSSRVCKCCNGKRKTHHGYIWRFVQEVNKDDINSGQ